MAITTIHIGDLIQQQLNKQQRSAAWLAKQIHCDASNFSKKLKKTSIDTELLVRISIALKYDFFALYSEAIRRELRKLHKEEY